MKKYLYLLMVAIFAAMSFTLTSCNNDDKDDEPDGNTNSSKASCTVTIDGQKFPAKYGEAYREFINDMYHIAIVVNEYEVGEFFYITIGVYYPWEFYDGADVTDSSFIIFRIGDTRCQMKEIVGGRVVLSKYDENQFTIDFNNVVVVDESGNKYKLNGSLTAPKKSWFPYEAQTFTTALK